MFQDVANCNVFFLEKALNVLYNMYIKATGVYVWLKKIPETQGVKL